MFRRWFHRISAWAHHAAHRWHWLAHCCYFAAVALESHGFYGWFAGALFLMTLADQFAGKE